VPFTLVILATIVSYAWIFEPRGVPVTAPAVIVVAATLLSAITAGSWGLSARALRPAARGAALFTAAAIPLILVAGSVRGTLHLRDSLAAEFLALIPWGAAQQWVLQTVVLREAQRVTASNGSVVLAAALFAAVHLPNPFLTAMTFAGALGWCAIFTRHPNILPLALSHAIATLAILCAFDDATTGRLRIGDAYLRLRN
jgi:hypothetical protein